MQRHISDVDCSWFSDQHPFTLWTEGLHLDVTYVVASLWLPEPNIFRSQTDNISLAVHDTGPGATCTDIDADIVVKVWMKLIMRICRHLWLVEVLGRV